MQTVEEMFRKASNRVLTLLDYSGGPDRLKSFGFSDMDGSYL